VTALSRQQWSAYPSCGPWRSFRTAWRIAIHLSRKKPGDYACYLGRFTSGKGPLQAIEACGDARTASGDGGAENKYFPTDQTLLGGPRGWNTPVTTESDGARPIARRRRVLLYPIQFPEAFGLVLVEAMLCGTPVAAMRLGCSPEIVDDGITGYTAVISRKSFPSRLPNAWDWTGEKFAKQAETRLFPRAHGPGIYPCL